LQIWDTAGQERFQGLGTHFYRGAEGVCFVFDVTRKKTFEELAAWKKAFLIQIGNEGSDSFPMIILANKIDLENREVTKKEVEQFCSKEGITFYETSAKESINVDKAFEQVARLILSRTKEENIKYDVVDLSQQEKKDGGCPC